MTATESYDDIERAVTTILAANPPQHPLIGAWIERLTIDPDCTDLRPTRLTADERAAYGNLDDPAVLAYLGIDEPPYHYMDDPDALMVAVEAHRPIRAGDDRSDDIGYSFGMAEAREVDATCRLATSLALYRRAGRPRDDRTVDLGFGLSATTSLAADLASYVAAIRDAGARLALDLASIRDGGA